MTTDVGHGRQNLHRFLPQTVHLYLQPHESRYCTALVSSWGQKPVPRLQGWLGKHGPGFHFWRFVEFLKCRMNIHKMLVATNVPTPGGEG